MTGIRLTQRRVESLRCQGTTRDVRDSGLKGYGIRLSPSGAKRYFLQGQHHGRRIWKTVGDADAMSEAEARERARSIPAALRDDKEMEASESGEALFETVAEEVFIHYGRCRKPPTMSVNRFYLSGQILPYFPVAESQTSTIRMCRPAVIHVDVDPDAIQSLRKGLFTKD